MENLNPLSHPDATLAPQLRQSRASGDIKNYLLSRYSDILSMIIEYRSANEIVSQFKS